MATATKCNLTRAKNRFDYPRFRVGDFNLTNAEIDGIMTYMQHIKCDRRGRFSRQSFSNYIGTISHPRGPDEETFKAEVDAVCAAVLDGDTSRFMMDNGGFLTDVNDDGTVFQIEDVVVFRRCGRCWCVRTDVGMHPRHGDCTPENAEWFSRDEDEASRGVDDDNDTMIKAAARFDEAEEDVEDSDSEDEDEGMQLETQ